MTRVKFFADVNSILGFCVSGHSSQSCEDTEGKLVCSAVSSAVYMTANTITDVIGDRCSIDVDDGEFSLTVQKGGEITQKLLEGLRLHLTELSKDYPERIKIIT